MIRRKLTLLWALKFVYLSHLYHVMNQHVNAYRNRMQWLALAAEVALLPLPPARAQAKRAGQAATGGFASFMETLILSVLQPLEVRA